MPDAAWVRVDGCLRKPPNPGRNQEEGPMAVGQLREALCERIEAARSIRPTQEVEHQIGEILLESKPPVKVIV